MVAQCVHTHIRTRAQTQIAQNQLQKIKLSKKKKLSWITATDTASTAIINKHTRKKSKIRWKLRALTRRRHTRVFRIFSSFFFFSSSSSSSLTSTLSFHRWHRTLHFTIIMSSCYSIRKYPTHISELLSHFHRNEFTWTESRIEWIDDGSS